MRPHVKEFLKLGLAICAWLLVFDLALNGVGVVAARAGAGAASLARYLDYGRSVEGKLSQAIGPDGKSANAVVSAGWLDPSKWHDRVSQRMDGQHMVMAVYGQSFALNVTTEAAKSNPHWQLRGVAAPAAPLSHSYAAYQLDKDRSKAQVVVVGILASALERSSSMSGLSFSFESPAPYTFPRYVLTADGLQAYWPAVATEAQFRQAFAERGQTWSTFKRELLDANPDMDRFQFNAWAGDASSLVRLARRGWVSAQVAKVKAEHANAGPSSKWAGEVEVAKAQLISLRLDTTQRGEKLVVLLLQDQGYDHALTRAFGDFLREQQIAVLDSSDVVNSLNPANFKGDGHFSDPANAKLAQAFTALLQR